MKRFYKLATAAPQEGGWSVLLDGRTIKTVGKRPQIVPTEALALAMAAEWNEQGEEIDTRLFVLRDLADYAIDAIAPNRAHLIKELVPYAETDTLCYRADEGEAFYDRQQEIWEPVLKAAESRYDVHFQRINGVMHQAQPQETIARLEGLLASFSNFELAALRMASSLAASLLLGLAALDPHNTASELWDIANLEEDWQVELWGKDEEAQALRQRRLEAFGVAMHFAHLSREA